MIPTDDDRDMVTNEIHELQTKLINTMSHLSYITSDAVLLVPRKEDTYDAVGVTLSYMSRSSDEFEVRVTNELADRIEATVKEWQKWVLAQQTPDEGLDF